MVLHAKNIAHLTKRPANRKTEVRWVFSDSAHTRHYFNLLILYHLTAGTEKRARSQPHGPPPPRHVLSSHLSTVSFFGVVIENHANISTTDLCTRHNIHVRIVRRKTHSHHIRLFDWTWFRIAVDQFTWNSLNLMEHCLCRWCCRILSGLYRTIIPTIQLLIEILRRLSEHTSLRPKPKSSYLFVNFILRPDSILFKFYVWENK